MTDYLKPRFTLPAGPRADVPWPFDNEKPVDASAVCRACGAKTVPGRAHIDQRDADAQRPRKRFCFGKVIARGR